MDITGEQVIPWLDEENRKATRCKMLYHKSDISTDRLLSLIAIAEAAQASKRAMCCEAAGNKPEMIYWNPLSNCVQCHGCGHRWVPVGYDAPTSNEAQ